MKNVFVVGILLFVTSFAQAQGVDGIRMRWSQPVEPYNVIENIYYVGASGISSHIIATDEGLILMDTGTTLMVPQIKRNIETLGFSIKNVKVILSSHAHWDHVEGHAEMKRRTGATIAALGEDAEAISNGVDNSALGGDGWEAVEIDRVLKDGDVVTLGGVELTAHHTPGHTKGCTTWTMSIEDRGKKYNVIFIGGTSINGGVNLVGNTRHPGILEDYAKTFQVLSNLEVDVFLAQHPSMYNMVEKMNARAVDAGTNPFIDPEGYRTFIDGEEAKYQKQRARETAE